MQKGPTQGAEGEATPEAMREEATRLIEKAAAVEAALIRNAGSFSETVAKKRDRPETEGVVKKAKDNWDKLMMKIFFPTAGAGAAVAGFGLAAGMAESNALNSPDPLESMGHSYAGVEQLRDVFYAGADIAAVSAAVLALYGTYRLGEKMLTKKDR